MVSSTLSTVRGSGTQLQSIGLDAKNINHLEEPVTLYQLPEWRLKLLIAGLCLCVFLSALDITIVSTSIVVISNDLHSFEQSSWVISSYLLTYFSFLIIWAKLSDFLGRKIMLVTAILVFLAFTGACGGAATTLQLIVLRAFQGIGGAGIFSMAPIIIAETVKPTAYAVYSSILSLAIACSFLLGPLIGGAVADGTTWRWIFFINLPIGAVGLAFLLIALPSGSMARISNDDANSSTRLRDRVDFPGFVLLLVACILLIFAIEEAGISYAWNSAIVVAFLALSAVLLCLFFGWERYLYIKKSPREPVFPWEFLLHRELMGIYLNAMLSGVPFVTLVLTLPGRFQSVNGESALGAGLKILPFTLLVAFGSIVTGALTAKGRVSAFRVLTLGTLLQCSGVGLLYSVSVELAPSSRLYGFQVLAGLGTGLSLTTLLNMVPFVMTTKSKLAVALGGVTQLRILGGAIGVAVATNLLNNTVKGRIIGILPPETINAILSNISALQELPAEDRALVKDALDQGYHQQLITILGFCIAEIVALALIWRRPSRKLM